MYSDTKIQTTQISRIPSSEIENLFIFYFFSCNASTNVQPKNIIPIGRFKDTAKDTDNPIPMIIFMNLSPSLIILFAQNL